MADTTGTVTRDEALVAVAELRASIAYQNMLIKRYRDALEEILSIEPMSPEGGHEAVAEIHSTARSALGVGGTLKENDRA